MRIRKSLLIVLLLSFSVTGCYTQLEYTQRANRITDEKPVEGYAWSDEPENKEEGANLTVADSIYIAETYGAKVSPYREYEDDAYYEEDYIPIEYKDYSVIDQYEACGCNPYKTYYIYDSYYPGSYRYYGSYYHSSWYPNSYWGPYYGYVSPFYHWNSRYYLGLQYYHRRYGYGFAFYWGSPYYYDPFFYDPFYYGYYRPVYYNSYYFGTYAGTVRSQKSNRRYGRRSIGADRVRSRDATLRDRTGVTRNNTATRSVRGRSIGTERSRSRTVVRGSRGNTTRSRGTTRVGSSGRSRSDSGSRSRGTVTRSRSGDNGSDARSRARGTVIDRNNDNRRQSVNRNSLRYPRNSILIPPSERREIESRIRSQRAPNYRNSTRNSSRRSFFGRFKDFFNNSRAIHSNSSSSRSRSFNVGNRSKSRSKVGSSRSSRSSVTRSRSSSKSSSSRSRSRGSSSKKRSRDNN